MPQDVTKRALASRIELFPEESITIKKASVEYEGSLFKDAHGFGIKVKFILDYKGTDCLAVDRGRVYARDGDEISLLTRNGDIYFYRSYIFRKR